MDGPDREVEGGYFAMTTTENFSQLLTFKLSSE